MRLVIVGGCGFVGSHVAEVAVRAGHQVVLADQRPPLPALLSALAGLPGQLQWRRTDVTDPASLPAVFDDGADVLVYGAAITGDAARDARDPEAALAVSLTGLVHAVRAARAAGVRRLVHLSSVAVLGSAIDGAPELTEALPARPVSLYGIGKFAAERTLERLADLWSLDAVSLRLSAVYGPWEHATGVRDSLSPHAQIRAAALAGRPALLARPGRRDWLHGEDVGSAVMAVAQAPKLPHRLYNVTTPHETTALEFGRALGRHVPGFECRLAAAGEAPTIDLHLPVDRPPLSPHRLATDLGWQARVDVEAAVAAMITALGRTAPPLA